MPTMIDATNAMKKIQATWGPWIPPHLLGYKAEDIFVFCDAQKYATYFSMVYEILFKKAGNYSQDAGAFVCGVPAFASPHPHSRRQLYISPKPGIVEKVLAHEYLHWLSHENFYPEYYKVGRKNPFRVEGITQWATVAAGYDMSDRVYEHEFLQTNSWLWADSQNQPRMLSFLFHGVATNVDAIHP